MGRIWGSHEFCKLHTWHIELGVVWMINDIILGPGTIDKTWVIIWSSMSGIVFIGLLIILISRLLLQFHYRREYQSSVTDQQQTDWKEVRHNVMLPLWTCLCLITCLSDHLSVRSPVCLISCLCLVTSLSDHLSVWSPVRLITCPSDHLFIWSPVCLITCMSDYLYVWSAVCAWSPVCVWSPVCMITCLSDQLFVSDNLSVCYHPSVWSPVCV